MAYPWDFCCFRLYFRLILLVNVVANCEEFDYGMYPTIHLIECLSMLAHLNIGILIILQEHSKAR